MLITRLWERKEAIFRPQFLGDKWPVVDFLVELIGAEKAAPYFFVQVKTTQTGYTNRDKRLRVKVEGRDFDRLAAYFAPTYVVAIDEPRELGYLISANGEWRQGMSSVSTQYPLDHLNQGLLWQEVHEFWERSQLAGIKSKFTDPRWRIEQ